MANLSRSVVLNILGENKQAKLAVDEIAKDATALDAMKPTVHIEADTSAAKRSVLGFEADIQALLRNRSFSVKAELDAAPAIFAASGLKAILDSLSRTVARPTVDLNTTGAVGVFAQIASIRAQMESLNHLVADPKIDLNTTGVMAQIAAIRAAIDSLKGRMISLGIDTHGGGIASIERMFQTLERDANNAFGAVSRDAKEAFNTIDAGAGGAGNSIRTMNAAADGGGRSFGVFTAQTRGWGTTLRWAAAGGAELAAVVIPALVGIGLYSIYAAKWVGNIGDQFQFLQAATKQTNPLLHETTAGVLGLGKGFQATQNAVKPQIYEDLGGALNAVKASTHSLTPAMVQLGNVFNNFMAKLVIDLHSQQFSGLFKFMVFDVKELGAVLGNLGHAFLNVASVLPHFAEILLIVANAIATVIRWISELPHWVIVSAVAMEEFNRWGGLLVNTMGRLGVSVIDLGGKMSIFEKFGAIFMTLGTSPLRILAALSSGFSKLGLSIAQSLQGVAPKLSNFFLNASAGADGFASKLLGMASATHIWEVALGVAIAVAIGFLVHWLITSQDVFTKYANSVRAAAENTKNLFQTQAFESGIIKLQNGMTQARAMIDRTNKSMQDFGNTNKNTQVTINSSAQAMSLAAKQAGFQGTAYFEAQAKVDAYNAVMRQMVIQMVNTVGAGARLAHEYGVTIPQAQAIAQAAGVNLAKSIDSQGRLSDTARQKIANLVQGYRAMGIQGGLLGTTMQAMSTQINIQDSQVQKVNQAWDTFIGLASNVESGFVGVLQGVRQMGPTFQLAAAGGKGLDIQLQQLSKLPPGGGLKGISDAALNLRSQFQQSLTSTNSFFDSIRTGMAAAGAASTGMGTLRTAVAGTIAQLLPFTAGSRVAQEQLMGLAKQAGFGGNNLKALLGWINANTGALTNNGRESLNSAGAQQKLSNIIQGMEGRYANLNKVAQQYSNTLQTNYINAIAGASQKTSGFNAALSKAQQDIAAGHHSFATAREDILNIDSAMRRAGLGAEVIRELNQRLAVQFGITGKRANDLTGELNKQANAGHHAASGTNDAARGAGNFGRQVAAYDAVRKAFANELQRVGIVGAHARSILDAFTRSIEKHGNTTQAYHGARVAMEHDINQLAASARKAHGDIDKMTDSTKRHGQAAATYHAPRVVLVSDIKHVGDHARPAAHDMDSLSNATRRHGQAAAAGHGAREAMVHDVDNLGTRAKMAASDLEKLTTAVRLTSSTINTGHGPRTAMVSDLQKISTVSVTTSAELNKITSVVKLLDTTIESGHGARQIMITDLQKIDQVSQTTRTMVTNLTDAIKLNTSAITAGHGARTLYITDIRTLGTTAVQTTNLIRNLTTTVQQDTNIINAGHGARQIYITDLRLLGTTATTTTNLILRLTTTIQQDTNIINAGHGARQTFISDLRTLGTQVVSTTNDINNLTRAINAIPKNTQINIKMTATGTFTVSQGGTPSTPSGSTPGSSTPGKGGSTPKHASGGLIPGHGNEDNYHAMLMPGEAVVPKHLVPQVAPFLAAHGVPGFEHYVGQKQPWHMASGIFNASWKGPSAKGEGPWLTNDYNTTIKDEEHILETDLKNAIAQLASGPLGGATGSELQNGRELYNYLLQFVFGGNKIAAAGATASIWGESTWNPFAQGTGGRGLIGWTPPGTISDAAFSGGMRTQLPAIIQFINRSGDWGVIQAMKSAGSVSQAAWEWGIGVERFGIPDVHPEGIALATSFMANGGMINEPIIGRGLATGMRYAFGERGPEMVTPMTMPPNRYGGGNVYVTVSGDTDPDGAALRIWQKLKDYKRHHGNVNLGLG